MRVLFVSGIDGFCHRYQVLHRAAQLTALGASTTVRHFADPRLLDDLAAHDVVFFYRVPESARVRAALERAGDHGIPRLAAIDDLIFVDDASHLPSLDALSTAEREQWRAGVQRYRATIEGCDAFVAPTEPLVAVADRLGWRAYLHRNSVAPAELELGRRARRDSSRQGRAAVVLGYFSGTPTHDEDFASIARALRDVLHAHPSVRLMVVGPLTLPRELEPLSDRIDRRPLVGWHELPALVAQVDVSLAPLATERRFAAAKGEIKYLEAAAVAVPTIASAISAYRHAICEDENGRLATTQDEWRRALGDLIRDRGLRARLGAAALADVATRYAEPARARELWSIIDDVRGGLSRRAQNPAGGAPPRATFDGERPARVALEPDACPAFRSGAPDVVSPPLASGSRLVQRIRIARDGLQRIDFHTVTYGQAQDQRLRVSLCRDDGALVGQAVLAADQAPDRGWLAFELDQPEARSAKRVYALEIVAEPGVPSGQTALSFGSTMDFALAESEACGVLGPALFDATPLAGALVVRGFAEWGAALRAEATGAGASSDDDPLDGAVRRSASTDDGRGMQPAAARAETLRA